MGSFARFFIFQHETSPTLPFAESAILMAHNRKLALFRHLLRVPNFVISLAEMSSQDAKVSLLCQFLLSFFNRRR